MSEKVKPKLKLVGKDGNVFAILSEARRVARKVGWSRDDIREYEKEATSGDYDNLLLTMMEYFEVS